VGPLEDICRRGHEGNETRPGLAEHIQVRNNSEGIAYPSPGLPRYVATPGYGPQAGLNPEGIAYAKVGCSRGGAGCMGFEPCGPSGVVRARGRPFLRAMSKPDPLYAFPSGMKRRWGARTRGSQRSAWQPRARVCIPFRNGSAGCVKCAGRLWIVATFGKSRSSPHRMRSPCRHHTPLECVALNFTSIHRSQSVFVAVAEQSAEGPCRERQTG